MSQSAVASGPELPGMRCVELIGSGGFADVYVYERDYPKGRVAVKLMRASTLDPAKLRQFTAEADTMAELAEHPFIVPVLGAGTAPDGRPYLVMRYYPSADLAVRVASNPMTVPDALRYGIQLASAVETAHRAGIIHRDIKPSNILLSSYGQPGLSDFGIAGRPSDASDDEDLGVSVPWSPPEVLTGASNGSVASDVYSLAATVWNLLVGRAPFHLPGGDNGERATFTRIVHGKPPATGRDDAPPSLDRLLQQAMAKDPAYRPQSALELARHFQRVEQEMRLARTEIVVLDQAGTAAPVRPPAVGTTAPAPSGTTLDARGADTNETRMKAPARVRDVQSAWGPPAATPPSPAATPPPVAAQTQPAVPPQPVPAAGAEEVATTMRPAVVAAQPAAPTEARPRRVEAPQPTPAAPRAGRRRTSLLVGGVTITAAAAVLIAILLSGGNGDDPPPTAGPTSQSHSAGEVFSQQLPDPQHLTGRVAAHEVTFTWAPVAGAELYIWATPRGSFKTVAQTHVSVPRSPDGQTCITVWTRVTGGSRTGGTSKCVG